ncbi:Oxygen-independent coproporphyrinogen III oxidase [gamma proteobacterium HdN1]|nr:Oxygen-independent coproporphyrinogen III oxidase [gamma proteobacterium HdN1]
MQGLPTNNKRQALWDDAFLKEHDLPGPRYASYPTTMQLHEEFTFADYRDAIQKSAADRRALALYVHLPFCPTQCYYCACDRVVTQDRDKMRSYLDHLIKEIRLVAPLVGKTRPIVQLQWGGGTPTYFDDSELTELMYHLGRHFNILASDRADVSIEIDPRSVSVERLGLLRGLGFNHISLGVQDFNREVQQGINRVLPEFRVEELVAAARSYRFRSVNLDFIYGLPHQNLQTMLNTMAKAIALSPDQISLFSYLHLPARYKAQGMLDEAVLPSPEERISMLSAVANQMLAAGYVRIGTDSFVKPESELGVAYAEGRLRRNFHGYIAHRSADLLGLGASAVSQIGDLYCQNTSSVRDYQSVLGDGDLPLAAGIRLGRDDLIRRDVIMSLICRSKVDRKELKERYNIDFETYFAAEQLLIKQFVSDGLLESDGALYHVTSRGKLVVRKICMAFDAYLPDHLKLGTRLSRVL